MKRDRVFLKTMAEAPPLRILFFGWGKAAEQALEGLFEDCTEKNFELRLISHSGQDEDARLDLALERLLRAQGADCASPPDDSKSAGGHVADSPTRIILAEKSGTTTQEVLSSTSPQEVLSSAEFRLPLTSSSSSSQQAAPPAPDSSDLPQKSFRCFSSHLFPDSVVPDTHSLITDYHPHLIVSVSYRKKIKCLDCASVGAVNFHPSLLPKHRGCFSGFWTIFDGDEKTGVTCHHMLEQFDAGLLVHVEELVLAGAETSKTLYEVGGGRG